jgi:ribosome-associated protein
MPETDPAPSHPTERTRPRVTPDADAARAFAQHAAQTLRDDRCTDIVVLDVRGRSPITDFIVIGSGTSDRQMNSALQSVARLGETLGSSCLGIQKDEASTWLLADFVDVMIHLFEPNTRAAYDLEMLWGDGPRVEIPPGPGPLAAKGPTRPGGEG